MSSQTVLPVMVGLSTGAGMTLVAMVMTGGRLGGGDAWSSIAEGESLMVK